MDLSNFYTIIFLCYIPAFILGITTTHHDKPDESSITNMAIMMNERPELTNITLTSAERAKRLLPYESFYQIQPFNRPRHQRPPEKYNNLRAPYPRPQDVLYKPVRGGFTPFLESNAIPGAFTPMVHPSRTPGSEIRYVTPNFGAIYEDLAQLKLAQRPAYEQAERIRYFDGYDDAVRPSKTTIETFTATSIDIPSGPGEDSYRSSAGGQQQIVLGVQQTNRYPPRKPYQHNSFVIVPAPDSQQAIRKPLIVIQRKPELIRNEAPKFVRISSRPNQHNYKEQPTPGYGEPTFHYRGSPKIKENYEIPKSHQSFVPLGGLLKHLQATNNLPKHEEFQKIPSAQPSQYEDSTSYQTTTRYEDFQKIPPILPQNPTVQLQVTKTLPKHEEFQNKIPPTPTQNSVPLGDLLKHLQATNTLPKTLTADNIDNSIKTLVRILDALKMRQRIIKPIVVQEESSSDYEEDVDNEAGVGISGYPGELPGTQSYPLDTEEGGTPGKAGVDYPALSTIPQTNFNCKTQRYKGFFGDPDTNCQVWHYCDLNGGQASFLCPNGTIFSQVALTCDWWFNVKCATTPQLYVLNERLYKYIIPLSPKFPEDYSGPLVDKYLALKFQEMEEKMRKEKKGKGNSINTEGLMGMEDVSGVETEKITMLESSTASSQKETLQSIEDDNSSE